MGYSFFKAERLMSKEKDREEPMSLKDLARSREVARLRNLEAEKAVLDRRSDLRLCGARKQRNREKRMDYVNHIIPQLKSELGIPAV